MLAHNDINVAEEKGFSRVIVLDLDENRRLVRRELICGNP